MVITPPKVDFALRPYEEDDLHAVLDLLKAALGDGPSGERSATYFSWKHLSNYFGPSFMLIALDGARVIGLRAFMRWEFHAGGRTYRALRAVDTATHPDYQGRGVFSQLTHAALELVADEADLIFNTPNAKSLSGYLKWGWQEVGKVPVHVRICRPARFFKHFQSARTLSPSANGSISMDLQSASEILADQNEVSRLLGSIDPEPGLSTPRDLGYLAWRYCSSPLDYRAVARYADDRLTGLAIFRVRSRGDLWEATVSDVIAGDLPTTRALLRAIAEAAPVDHITCRFPGGGAFGMASVGFLRAPGGITLVARPLRDGIEPDPGLLQSWDLSLGDLEVF